MNTFELSRDEIIERNPLERIVRGYGIELKTHNATQFKACCPFHADKTPSFFVDTKKNLFKCFGCDAAGSVIDFVSKKDGISVGDAMKKLSPAKAEPISPAAASKLVATYDYTDETGNLVYKVLRYSPKTFKQVQIKDGKEVWNMEGVRRVLYRLPRVLKSKIVWVVEGEKDADTLNTLGFIATCNVGGAGKWMDGYTDSLKGKEIVICGDNDKPGIEHVAKVLDSIAGKVKSVRVVKVPEPFKDISDYVASLDGADKEIQAQSVFSLVEKVAVLKGGINLPIKSISDLEEDYSIQSKTAHLSLLNLGNWLPSFSYSVRGLVPGELITILADTGVGKTMILQNIAISCRPIQTLLFEMELPGELTFERFAAIATGAKASEISEFYKGGKIANWRESRKLDHIHVCSEAKLSVATIEQYIIKSELVIGERPKLILLDYIGLVNGKGNSRYEKLSTIAEDLKALAKATGTILVVASQVKRDPDRSEVQLHDAKDSGSIENSSGLVLGAWREGDGSLLRIKILKNTKGRAGKIIDCDLNGENLRITERSKISDSDIPK